MTGLVGPADEADDPAVEATFAAACGAGATKPGPAASANSTTGMTSHRRTVRRAVIVPADIAIALSPRPPVSRHDATTFSNLLLHNVSNQKTDRRHTTCRGTVALADRGRRETSPVTAPGTASVFAGFRFPREVITVAVRWYLRYGLSYRDVEELLAERGVTVDHVTV